MTDDQLKELGTTREEYNEIQEINSLMEEYTITFDPPIELGVSSTATNITRSGIEIPEIRTDICIDKPTELEFEFRENIETGNLYNFFKSWSRECNQNQIEKLKQIFMEETNETPYFMGIDSSSGSTPGIYSNNIAMVNPQYVRWLEEKLVEILNQK